MSSCKDVLDKLWDYIDGECDKATVESMKKHLDLCRSCFSQIEFENLLRDQLRKKTNHCCPDKLKEKIKNLIKNY